MDADLKDRKRLGSRIRELRQRKGLSQAELGARAGLSGKFVGEIERGGNPSIGALFALAQALDDRASALLAEGPVPEASPLALTPAEMDKAQAAVDDLAAIFRRRSRMQKRGPMTKGERRGTVTERT